MSGVEEYQKILKTLKGVHFFEKLSLDALEQLLSHLKKLSCPKGYAIIREGDIGDSFFIIIKGSVSVWKKKRFFGKTQLASLGPDKFFGEMALVTNEPRTASVMAEDHCELLVLYKNDFKLLLESSKEIDNAVKVVLQIRKVNNQNK